MLLQLMLLLLSVTVAEAQIVISGSVYGGGNEGNVGGSTSVTVRAGDINKVYGGARMANIAKNALVNIDGENASNYILINYVYGGNDIAGTIGTNLMTFDVPDVLTRKTENKIDGSWNAFVRISTKTTTTGEAPNTTVEEDENAQKIYIGQLFGGSNGEYFYQEESGIHKIYDYNDHTKLIASNTTGFIEPVLKKTYLEILGGSIVYAYGGGNNATITDKTVICLDNPSKVVNTITDVNNPNADNTGELLTNDRFENKMGINTTLSYPESDAFQIGRLFGGNNMADMAIRPRWNLQRGKVRDLYGGGNEGRMTSPEGLLLQVEGAGMKVDNVYGGCRKADVRPLYDNDDDRPVAYEDIQLDPADNPNGIPGGYAARVRILDGDVNNVYGGNDISGNVYGGNTVGILTSIRGNVYGGGNGSYAYTDNPLLKDNPRWHDLYYNPDQVLEKAKVTVTDPDLKSAEALNIFRPNAEKVSILVRGTETKPVVIKGDLYVGGNSASLREHNSSGSSSTNSTESATHLKIGSYVTIGKVFLGNNGENMIKYNDAEEEASLRGEGVLKTFARNDLTTDGSKFNSMVLTTPKVFEKYMEGCAMKVKPNVLFESKSRKDLYDYIPYSTYIGSFYCGGNVGSILVPGKMTVDFTHEVVIYEKLVGGCNNAKVVETTYNAEYLGGLIGAPETPVSPQTIGDKLVLNLSGLKIEPKRWNNDGMALEWNTYIGDTPCDPETEGTWSTDAPLHASDDDMNRRLVGGNIYGGCDESGIVNGNVVINVNASIINRNDLFDEVKTNADDGEESLYQNNVLGYGKQHYHILKRHTGVILGQQGMDVFGMALNIFGGGKGAGTEIWGSTTINLNKGYVFQVFGGSEEGVIGQSGANGALTYNSAYSCYVNLKGSSPGVSKANAYNINMPECEFIYGGGFEGPIAGNTVVSLGNGRIFNSFAGSCDADIYGHTETYIGYRHDVENEKGVVTGQVDGFPYIRDMVYGGNDLGGAIKNLEPKDFSDRLRTYDDKVTDDPNNFDLSGKIHKKTVAEASNPNVLKASAYVEYNQGRAIAIFGGHYGTYDYTSTTSEYQRELAAKPYLDNTFVNFRPTSSDVLKNPGKKNTVDFIYGGSQGYPGDFDSNRMQDRSYVLIDIPEDMDNYKTMQVFGAGAWGGLGMKGEKVESNAAEVNLDKKSAIVDLVRGQIDAVYGGSYHTGFTRRTVVNVPTGSKIQVNNLFGGAYGESLSSRCDVYEANVNYKSADAMVKQAIYGGNNAYRRTLYGRVTIDKPVYTGELDNNNEGKLATVYGAGYGANTWSQYTEVNLKNGAKVAEVYGGGRLGKVMNTASVAKWALNASTEIHNKYTEDHNAWAALPEEQKKETPEPIDPGDVSLSLGGTYTDQGLNDPVVKSNSLGIAEANWQTGKFNTNVFINSGAVVDVSLVTKSYGPGYDGGYAYAGGLGDSSIDGSGDVYGTTYIGLLGGEVKKDLYAGGTVGSVMNRYEPKDATTFTAKTYAYIEGGTARNVYGGGWQGSVGKHTGAKVDGRDLPIAGPTTDDVLGESNVVIGIRKDLREAQKKLSDGQTVVIPATLTYTKGIPAIQRNIYSGGEGGAVYGTANLTINNGYIGYTFENKTGTTYTNYSDHYKEKLNDETWSDGVGENRLEDCGSAFGGGYDDLSSVDFTNVKMYGGIIRNSLHGGGEIATIGRGTTKQSSGAERDLDQIFKNGKTHVEMYNGHVLRNVFAGGKGYNKLKYGVGNELYTDGYVFGQTEVYIHGGEIGTEEGIAKEYGNVFGGGDIGYVYSSGYKYANSRKTETGSPGHYYYYNHDAVKGDTLTEDCKVVISPYLQVAPDKTVTDGGKTYQPYDYVPTEYLNTLGKKTSQNASGTKQWPEEWNNLITAEGNVDRGIIIHNGVFAGGNVSTSSDKTYANATTVFGNVTATLYDVYHRDFITIGTEHVGGLYGGGNFSMVDGYRELNVTNYGTDYFSLDQQIDLPTYRTLSNRERAYFKLKYECKANVIFRQEGVPDSREYIKDEKIDEDVYLRLLDRYGSQVESAFTPWGICSIYAGRLLNTIQRADFCGVFGSRMVLQGAKDRVADTEQNTDYTINRVGELSLNKKRTIRTGSGYSNPDTGADVEHGNYFGIYSVVNCLGNLTSDVHFYDPYEGSVEEGQNKTYYGFKASNPTSGKRNMAKCLHQVALASGVHLELTTENSTEDRKDYGYITGVVELDLINVKKDKVMGGGFVYAKNEHHVPKYFPNKKNVLLAEHNQEVGDEAITYKRFCYRSQDEPSGTEAVNPIVISRDGTGTGTGGNDAYTLYSWQTSGNFIHPEKHIVDDCYPTNNAYIPGNNPYSEAHYWYVKGEVYVYDQIVTAYTGSASAYQKESQLNLTITAASNGKLQLLNVKPNLYAYKMPVEGEGGTITVRKIGTVNDADDKPIDHVTVNNEHDTYKLNDVITWWDWHQLSESERAYFVTNTYVNCVDCKVDGILYKAGTYVMDDTDFTTFKNSTHTILNSEGEPFLNEQNVDIGLSYVFRSSNNISHDEGYVLTFDMTTPTVWGKYYTSKTHSEGQTDQTGGDNYLSAPTYYPTTDGVYGTHNYVVGEILTKATVDAYAAGFGDKVKPAYVAVNKVTYTSGTSTATANAGSAISKTVFDGIADAGEKANFEPAYVCISTVKLADGVYLGKGDLLSASQIATLKTKYAETKTIEDEQVVTIENAKLKADIDAAMKEAYICVEAGQFGGQQFSNTQNYDVIDAWCALSKTDRTNGGFTFNQDALDLLADHDYVTVHNNSDILYPLESRTRDAYGSTYSSRVPIEYDAICDNAFIGSNSNSYTLGQKISQSDYEALPNDQCHYTRVELEEGATKAYIVLDNFTYYGVPYSKGQVIDDSDTYFDIKGDDNYKDMVTEKDFGSSGTHYYCYETYTGASQGDVITEANYNLLPNEQKNFIIQGKEPVETSTLYVSSESDIFDVSKERVYTVVYQYTYYENEDRNNVKFTNELHVINVHVQMESGVPIIGPIAPPEIVLPGTAVTMTTPDVTVGSYPPLGNGWEIYSNETDAKLHRNGEEYDNGVDPLYWYQNGDYYINFYSRNYLGKMYAPKPMPLKVANYHDLDAVMKDKAHHMYVDRPDVDRPSKIYIDDRTCESDGTKSELDLLKDFFDLSVVKDPTLDGNGLITGNDNTTLNGHTPLDDHVHGARNLEFILRGDVSPKAYTTWTPIGSNNTIDNPNTTDVDEALPDGQCFEGNLHGDGYTISGLTSSLFAHFCGEAYNLGVTGSFTSSGIADTGSGYLENCWVKSSNITDAKNAKAVFGTPITDTWTGARTMHMVNCYYPTENQYTAHDGGATYGLPIEKPLKAFYNGEVAYNLNDFYLFKRYSDHKSLSGTDTYKYYKTTLSGVEGEKKNDNGTLSLVENARYEANGVDERTGPYLLSDDENHFIGSYVEWRYADGDFMYAAGTIPSSKNERTYTVTDNNGNKTEHYYPIWPDDYIYFGQALNYNHVEGQTHQAEPSAINKLGGRLVDTNEGNRVFRAPAYFGSSTMSVAHFNPYAVFAQSKADDATVEAYKGMTAIDFSGGNGDLDGGYKYGAVAATSTQSAKFYPPLLDDDGIVDFTNVDLTRNLLVYTDATNASTTTENTIMTKLIEEKYQETNADTYRTVAEANNLRQEKTVRGHWVKWTGAAEKPYQAVRDHYLVDKEEFNAPIEYWFDNTHRMWYQRLPETYVGKKKADGTGFIENGAGWEGISLPFTAELVTTNTKGEITHFYGTSTTGHEYWLRKYKGQKDGTSVTDGVFTADFQKLDAADGTKSYTNTFLWDHYYSNNTSYDLNSDQYPGSYYSTNHTYVNYPYLACATPYIIGFPGERYYEFDLSGNFEAKTAKATTPVKISAQVITFVSPTGETIHVSDDEMSGKHEIAAGYDFVPNFASKTLSDVAYILNTDDTDVDKRGSSYVKVESGAQTVPFRPYFTASTPGAREMTRSIIFSDEQTQLEGKDDHDLRGEEAYSLSIYGKRKKIVVESNLRETTEVRIVNPAGITINTFDIEPGETVETRIYNSGVYIVQTTDGHYNKKLVVR